ncbi:hypothetical protein [Parafrankia sp. EUN1f]|uniref:hypothetical protein n=1 Tax=Parafrankia sp. EUN1f TaxID=102897 RepID=UPI0001C459C8|nr:hypothetical protein [Parafrankia sp. EUN1f]EFC84681.1 hypothetical protein FrEUN1fDRAFT_2236 [Parafrankia sp. EUN1f]
MSGEQIQFNGDELAEKVPMLADFREAFLAFGEELAEGIAQHNFARDAHDEVSKLSYAMFKQLMKYFGKIYDALGEAVGVQGDRLEAVRTIGEATETDATHSAGGWSGGGARG